MLGRTALALLALVSLAACLHSASPVSEGFRQISPAELQARRTAGGKLAILDANGDDFRGRHGVIPGAILLTHFRNYDPKELPADKDTPLVFYCANRM